MRRIVTLATLIVAALAAAASPAFAGAWTVRRAWTDKVRPADADSPTYAEAYPEFVRATAPDWERQGIRLDCADFSISLYISYAAREGLPVSFKYWSMLLGRYATTSSTEARFTTRDGYDSFIRGAVNAQNLTVNTRAIGYDEWASGDMVLMNWNQSQVEPNFPGRDVWHTFLIGLPDELLFYGNLDNGQPLPIVSTNAASRLDQVRNHPDRHGSAPRRWSSIVFRPGWHVPERAIAAADERGFVTVNELNVRRGPGTGRAVFTRVRKNAELRVTGRYRDWLRATLPSGELGWVSSAYISKTPAAAPVYGRVTASSLNVRSGPGVTYVTVARVTSGTRLQVLSRHGDWYRVVLPGQSADPARYVSAAFVRLE